MDLLYDAQDLLDGSEFGDYLVDQNAQFGDAPHRLAERNPELSGRVVRVLLNAARFARAMILVKTSDGAWQNEHRFTREEFEDAIAVADELAA